MARLSRIVFAGLLALAGASAHAGYAQLAPPPGFAPMPTASPERWGYAKAANEAWVNNTVRNTASLNVGGQAVKVPALQRLAANAPRFAAAAVFLSPQLRFALGVASWLSAAKFVWDEATQQWKKSDSLGTDSGASPSDGKEYHADYNGGSNFNAWFPTPDAACASGAGAASLNNKWASFSITETSATHCGFRLYLHSDPTKPIDSSFIISSRQSSCPVGWYVTPAGCVQTPPPVNVNEQDFVDGVTTKPMPSTVPNELPPGTPLPVKPPVINPTPGDNPQPQPYFVPQGDPVPNPNYDPNAAPSPQNQPYIIPGVRIVPSPTADEPWRVDVQPVNRPTPIKDPLTPDELNPQPDPNADPNTQPDPGKDDKAKPEEQQSLCEKHPEILACQKLDKVQPTELAKEDININISPVAGWGSDSAACPAPRAVVVAGKSVEISWQPVCDFASGLRPLVIALAWLSAVSMVIVVARRN